MAHLMDHTMKWHLMCHTMKWYIQNLDFCDGRSTKCRIWIESGYFGEQSQSHYGIVQFKNLMFFTWCDVKYAALLFAVKLFIYGSYNEWYKISIFLMALQCMDLHSMQSIEFESGYFGERSQRRYNAMQVMMLFGVVLRGFALGCLLFILP